MLKVKDIVQDIIELGTYDDETGTALAAPLHKNEEISNPEPAESKSLQDLEEFFKLYKMFQIPPLQFQQRGHDRAVSLPDDPSLVRAQLGETRIAALLDDPSSTEWIPQQQYEALQNAVEEENNSVDPGGWPDWD